MKAHYELRKATLNDLVADRLVLHLPVVVTGSLARIREWAGRNGLTWKRDSNVFGGYYVDSNGCLTYYVT